MKRVCSAALLVIVGCGPAPEPMEESVPERSMEEVIEDIVVKNRALICRSLFQCPEHTLDDWGYGYGRYPDEQACASVGEDSFFLYADDMAAARQGRKSLSTSKVEMCLAYMEAQFAADPCNYRSNILSPCLSLFDGAVEVGEPCLRGDCLSKFARCGVDESGESCYGTCQISQDSYCAFATCGDDEICTIREDAAVCVKRTLVGEPCGMDDFCGLEDERATCLMEGEGQGVCVTIGTVPQGGSCGDNSSVCPLHLDCIEGVCARPDPGYTVVAQGGDCSADDATCEPGLRCVFDLEGRSCEPVLLEGESCDFATSCASKLICFDALESGERVCTPLREVGQSCQGRLDCKESDCVEGVCGPKPQGCMVPSTM